MAHGSLLVNLASPEGRIRNSSVSSLLADLKVAAEVGLDAVCFHVGYAKGHPSADAALILATRKLGELIARMPAGPRLLIENSCEGSELGQTIDELARLIRDVGAPPEQLGLLIDTCHLHAAGFDLAGADSGQRLADALAAEGVLERVVAFHLNDSQLACGAHRDRHAIPGAGTIGTGVVSVATPSSLRDAARRDRALGGGRAPGARVPAGARGHRRVIRRKDLRILALSSRRSHRPTLGSRVPTKNCASSRVAPNSPISRLFFRLARALPLSGDMELMTPPPMKVPPAPIGQHQRTRRTTRRANVSWTVFARVRGQRLRFHTVDVSARGAKLRPRGDLQAGQSLTLQFVKPNGQPVSVEAMVWRVDADGFGVFFLGTAPDGLMS